MLTYVDQEPYRGHIKGMHNLQEGRHTLAGHEFHGRKPDGPIARMVQLSRSTRGGARLATGARMGLAVTAGEPIAMVIPWMGALGVLGPVDWIDVSFVGLYERADAMLEVAIRARPDRGLHSEAVQPGR